jgi:hypothetical protein
MDFAYDGVTSFAWENSEQPYLFWRGRQRSVLLTGVERSILRGEEIVVLDWLNIDG